MFEIDFFEFTCKNDVNSKHTFINAQEAIEYFNKKGYGMQNFIIRIGVIVGNIDMNKTITLDEFNDFVDKLELYK